MSVNPKVPLPLRLAAWLVIMGGLPSVIKIGLDIAHGHPRFDFGFIWIYAGFRLLKRSNAWRWIVIFTSIATILFSIFFMTVMSNFDWPTQVALLGWYTVKLNQFQAFGLIGLICAIEAFVIIALCLPKIRSIFRHGATMAKP